MRGPYYDQGCTIDLSKPDLIMRVVGQKLMKKESTIHERLIGFDFVLGRPFDRLAVT